MSLINTQVKPFRATAYHQGKYVDISERNLMGQWSVVFFYAADFTFVCPTELENLAENYAHFTEIDVEIYAVSTDTHFAHKVWAETSPALRKVKYPLVGDMAGNLARNFGVMIEVAGIALRGTFVMNPGGYIKAMEVLDLGVGRDAQHLLRVVKAAQCADSYWRGVPERLEGRR
jgi:peroxiredoxin